MVMGNITANTISRSVVISCSGCRNYCLWLQDRKAVMSQSEFESLKASLISRNQLWEDDDFPAAPESLAIAERRSPYIRWLRPWVSYSL